MILVCGCHCGSTEMKARNFLRRAGYKDWDKITIHRGKEASRALVRFMPDCLETRAFNDFLDDTGTWCVIIGFNDEVCRWSDIAHNTPKSTIEAELIVERFA